MLKIFKFKFSSLKQSMLIIAPALSLLIIIFADLDPGNRNVTYTFAIAFLMAAWWISEAIPLAVTALIPVVLFPLLGVVDGKTISALYFNHVIFLFNICTANYLYVKWLYNTPLDAGFRYKELMIIDTCK